MTYKSKRVETLTEAVKRNVDAALAEDIATGDWTARLIPSRRAAQATVICRSRAVLCGQAWFDACFRYLDRACSVEWAAPEGSLIEPGTPICRIAGRARVLLTAERSALNFLQLLSAVATRTRTYVDAVAGTSATIVDTRKTLPGLRLAQKHAVRTGGGSNHRSGLYDAVLIKENHIAAAGGVAAALRQARTLVPPGVWIQVEVESLDQLEEALAESASMILLDNMSPAQMREAVRHTAGRAQLEASGGITLDNVRQIAETGVNRISIGTLTKDVTAVDLSLRFAA